jgi:16S rRNA (cytosine967-C5)-methyltransferase
MTAREIAFQVLRRVEEGGAFASRALDAALASAGAIDPREAGLATELVYGTLRRALSLDAALAPHASRPLAEIDPAARVALRVGAYQMLYLATPPHAAVGETVELAKRVDHGRASGFVNAVLRALARDPRLPEAPPLATDPVGHVASAESVPAWLASEWVSWLGADEALALARAMNQPAPLVLRSPCRDELVGALKAAAVEAEAAQRSPDGVVVRGVSVQNVVRAAGKIPFQVQDEAAQLVSLFAAGHLRGRDALVLDACAAPGGKTFHLAEMLGPGGEVVAVEIHPRKADELRREARRRGLDARVRVLCADSARPLPGIARASFDAVLVDAPCTGLGTLRRHPELKLRRIAGDPARMAVIQREVLLASAGYAKPGAPVTYSVCSLTRAEGPEVAAWAFAQGLARAGPPAGLPADVLTADGDLLTLPSRHGCDGFYAARLAAPAAGDKPPPY